MPAAADPLRADQFVVQNPEYLTTGVYYIDTSGPGGTPYLASYGSGQVLAVGVLKDNIAVFDFYSLTIAPGASLYVQGSNSLALLSYTDMDIGGTIVANGQNGTAGPTRPAATAYAGGAGGLGVAGGAGGGHGGGSSVAYPGAGGYGVNGGGNGQLGGDSPSNGNDGGGGGGAGPTGAGGSPNYDTGGVGGGGGGGVGLTEGASGGGGAGYGNGGRGDDNLSGGGGHQTINMSYTATDGGLQGGGAGGGGGGVVDRQDGFGSAAGSGGGGGGGGIELQANGNLTIDGNGAVQANGGNGGAPAVGHGGYKQGGAGGGGGGGGIILDATNVSVVGTVSANGGNGGTAAGSNNVGGYGGGGQVLVAYAGTYSNTGTITESVGQTYGYGVTPGTTAVFFIYPTLSGVPNSVSLGNVLVGGNTGKSTFSLSNGGLAGSTLTGTVSGAGSNGLTMVNSGGTAITSQSFSDAQGASTTVNLALAPTQRGNASLTAAVASNGGTSNVAVTGKGVAPVESDTGNANAGYVRRGTTGSASVTVTNVGDGNTSGAGAASNLRGTANLAPNLAFTQGNGTINLTDGSSKTISYSYRPTAFGAQSGQVSLSFTDGSTDGTNVAFTNTATVSGTGVGPSYASTGVSAGGTLDFGQVTGPATAARSLTLGNTESLTGLSVGLTGLTILGYTITGADAADFSITNWAGPIVLHDTTSLSAILQLLFDPHGQAGTANAMLTIITDQDAAFGTTGDSFTYNLIGTAAAPIPAPAGITLLVALFPLLRRRRPGLRSASLSSKSL